MGQIRQFQAGYPRSGQLYRPIIIDVGVKVQFVNQDDWKANGTRTNDCTYLCYPSTPSNYNRFNGFLIVYAKKAIPRDSNNEYIP